MRVKHWIAMALLLSLAHAHAEETEADPPLELIELLGEMDEEGSDLDIAMSDTEGKLNEKETPPQEVKDDE